MKNVPNSLGNLKIKVDKLDVDKLVLVPVEKIKHNEDKIFDITNLATNASLNAKINDLKSEIPNTLNLATNTVFTAVENTVLDHYK